jgi:SAM-dependent methyltransferase
MSAGRGEPVSGPESIGEPIRALYPEVRAGGFSRVDGTVEFYVRVSALLAGLGPEAVVLDYGAGRGAFVADPVEYRRDIRILKGKARNVIGVDVDNAVLRNETVDEAHVVMPGHRLPLADLSVDLIVSDSTLEHVVDPAWTTAELDRVLKPGGWFCARTPNRSGYIGLGARAVPNRLHVSFLRRLQPVKRAEDTFPTAYRLNTPADLKRWFSVSKYDHVVYAADGEPSYVGRSVLAARLSRLAFFLTPPRYRSVLYVFLHKTGGEG